MTGKRTEAICEHCGKLFWKKKSTQKFCCHVCAESSGCFYRNRISLPKNCPICHKDFQTFKRFQKYCGDECRKAANRISNASWVKSHRYELPFHRIRFAVLTRDGFRCHYCGRGPEDGVKLVVDHILAKRLSGSDELRNFVTACADCNSGKSDILLLATKTGQLPTFIRLAE